MFKNIEEIKSKFNIKDENIDIIKKEIKSQIFRIHPDKHGGKFKNKNDKEKLNELTDALNFIDNFNNTKNNELIKIDDVIKILDVIKKNSQTTEINLKERFNNSIENYYKLFKSKFTIPKISTLSISGLLSLIWTFPNIIKDHPILNKYIITDSFAFNFIWLYALLLTGVYWIIVKNIENSKKQLLNYIKSDEYQTELFLGFEKYIKSYNKKEFNKIDFKRFIKSFNKDNNIKYSRKFLLFIFFRRNEFRLDDEIMNDLINIIIQKTLDKQLIKEIKKKTLGDYYSF